MEKKANKVIEGEALDIIVGNKPLNGEEKDKVTAGILNDAVQGKGNRHPLVFFDAAVIVSVQISKIPVFIQRILLYIQSGRINMCS